MKDKMKIDERHFKTKNYERYVERDGMFEARVPFAFSKRQVFHSQLFFTKEDQWMDFIAI